jgi:hypothetical protein
VVREVSGRGIGEEPSVYAFSRGFCLSILNHETVSGLRKIRAHLRIINDNAYHEKRPRHHSSRKTEDSRGRVRNEKEDGRYRDDSRGRSRGKKDSGRYYDDNKRRQSVRFDSPPQTYYVPDPPLREQDIEWPQSAGSIEYFPLKEQFPTHEKDEDPEVVQLARLQRSASVSYSQPRDRPSSTHAGRSEWTAQRERERGRSRRREARESSSQPGSDSSSSEDHEKLGYRSRR